MIRFDILTLFPKMFSSPLDEGMLKRAQEKNLIDVRIHNIRDFALDKHHTADDYPYGGGQGMVMKAEPIIRSIEKVKSLENDSKVILMTPQGRRLDQRFIVHMSKFCHLIIVCGRYEGVDERVRQYVDEEISIGDYIISGGELAAMVLLDAVSRMIPRVLGNSESIDDESFCNSLLEYPQYTRPREHKGLNVPEELLSGNHQRINDWRRFQSLKRTLERRPDLLEEAELSGKDIRILSEIKKELDISRKC
ncbi:MAG: tRNA (guanosine(37)-N1)-methyltransferase TrmD [Thermodesulfobacteriota bacterium]|nr:tRNA (guanosine(37)-N1)-methyltransferase TrmD [Thermodesulfobacteriota bacterium]